MRKSIRPNSQTMGRMKWLLILNQTPQRKCFTIIYRCFRFSKRGIRVVVMRLEIGAQGVGIPSEVEKNFLHC